MKILDPARAESLIMSADRFKMKLSSKYLPRLPINGVEDDLDSTLELDEALAEDAEYRLYQDAGGSDNESEFDDPLSDTSENDI